MRLSKRFIVCKKVSQFARQFQKVFKKCRESCRMFERPYYSISKFYASKKNTLYILFFYIIIKLYYVFRFWSYMVYDPGCIASVISFLQDATPFFTPITTLTTDNRVIKLYKQCMDNCIKVIFRLVTEKESETEWLTKEHLSKLLYSNFLISIPVIFDILIAYGRTNRNVLQELLMKIFTLDYRYVDDLKVALQYLKKSFQSVQEKIDENDQKTNFHDLAVYTLDCSATIGILLEVYPDSIQLALDIQLEQCITNFYDLTLPLFYKHICAIHRASPSLTMLNQSRMELLGSFRCMTNVYLERILNFP